MSGVGTNTGHGHVWKRPDGVRMRCGGPGMCTECALDAARLKSMSDPTTAETPTMRYGFYVNGDLWAECDTANRAELIMDACATTFSSVASFDVMPLNETQD